MTEFAHGFWLWASDHWALGFCLLCISLWLSASVLRAFFKMFHRRPAGRLTIQLPPRGSGRPGRVIDSRSTNEEINQTLQEILKQSKARPKRMPQQPTVYDRIGANADDESDDGTV